MPKSRRCFLWANGTERASLSGAPPSQTGLTVCDADWWWARWAECRAWPRLGRAWGARKSRSRQQKSARPSRLVLRFGGVFFQPSPKAGNSFGAGLDVAIDRTLQDEAQPLEPVLKGDTLRIELREGSDCQPQSQDQLPKGLTPGQFRCGKVGHM